MTDTTPLPAWYPDLLDTLQKQDLLQITFVHVTDAMLKYRLMGELKETLGALLVPSSLQTVHGKSSYIYTVARRHRTATYMIVFDATGASTAVQWLPFVEAIRHTKQGTATNWRASKTLRFSPPVVLVLYKDLPPGRQLTDLFAATVVAEHELPV